MRYLYTLSIYSFQFILGFFGFFNKRIRDWNYDRRSHFRKLDSIKKAADGRTIVWMHCASLGEYEQGIPLVKAMKNRNPRLFVLLSFFSPSGYTYIKRSNDIDSIIYMPLDTLRNARVSLSIIKPKLYIGVKYEFWWNFLSVLNTFSIPIVFISVVADRNSFFLNRRLPFVKWLSAIDFFFTQDDQSTKLLREAGCMNVHTAGDTRVLSVIQRFKDVLPIDILSSIIPIDKVVIIYGSIYLSDFDVISTILNDDKYFHIVVPHDISPKNISAIKERLNPDFVTFTELSSDMINVKGLVVDTMGHLFSLYQYCDMAYIGGGFERSIHNTIEPAVFALPLSIGPKHQNFIEAQFFLSHGIATEVNNAVEFEQFVLKSLDKEEKVKVANLSKRYFEANSNSVDCILSQLDGKLNY